MKILTLLASLFFCFGCSSLAQSNQSTCKQEFDSTLNMFVFTEVDLPPFFPGGTKAFIEYFAENFSQSDTFSVYQTDFKFQFIIDTSGYIIGEQIRKKKASELSPPEKEALKLLHRMPKWKPGQCKGVLVPVKVNFPVKF